MRRLEEKIRSVYEDVFIYAKSRVENDEQARDITQTVMEKVILKIDTLRSEKSFKAWVMTITRNEVNTYFNQIKRYNRTFVSRYGDPSDGDPGIDVDVEDIKTDILGKLIDREEKINIMSAMERIDLKYRNVIRLNVICEYNLIETAEILNVNVNTVRTWSARGLVKLREEFEKLDSEEQI